jgi:hypothetical protein
VLTLALSIPSLVRAQDVASLTGNVTDTSGAIIVGADVALVNTATNASYHATTNSLGSYTISNVPPGPGYKITFSAKGFEPVNVTDVYLNVANTRTQDAQLHPGNVNVAVEVSAASQDVTINTTDATIGNNINVELVNSLPVQGRQDPTTLFNLQPGVSSGAITGARTDQNSMTVDGLDVSFTELLEGIHGSMTDNRKRASGSDVTASGKSIN